MNLFGSHKSFLGVDLGTSTAKIVELAEHGNEIQLVTYAEANVGNMLVEPADQEGPAIEKTITLLQQMIEKSGSTARNVIAALPGGSVFSTVLMLPNISEEEMEKAVKFAAGDVVPADIDDMVIGWSRVGSASHMQTDRQVKEVKSVPADASVSVDEKVPVFVTAAPKDIVNRYITVFQRLNLTLMALEVETFPLMRSLLPVPPHSTLIVDIGSRATTFHIIDKGIPRVSQTIDLGGYTATGVEEAKIAHGILPEQDAVIKTELEKILMQQVQKAKELLAVYEQQEKHSIETSVLIGGGANLKGLQEFWKSQMNMPTVIGNPWQYITKQKQLDLLLESIGPRYGVAVGLALRGFAQL